MLRFWLYLYRIMLSCPDFGAFQALRNPPCLAPLSNRRRRAHGPRAGITDGCCSEAQPHLVVASQHQPLPCSLLHHGYRDRKLKLICRDNDATSTRTDSPCDQNMPRSSHPSTKSDLSSASSASPLHRLPVNPRRKKVAPDERKRVATA